MNPSLQHERQNLHISNLIQYMASIVAEIHIKGFNENQYLCNIVLYLYNIKTNIKFIHITKCDIKYTLRTLLNGRARILRAGFFFENIHIYIYICSTKIKRSSDTLIQ